jgi:translocation and assembly module TamA
LGSDTDLLQTRLQGKFVRPLGQNQRLLLRGDLGLSYVSDFDALPATLRFFAGGDQSVRGYAYNSLGPEDASGEVIGGRHLVVGSIEYERRIKEKWGAAVFYDVGNALNSLGDPLRYSVGIGARWRSPVGPVRVDLGIPITEAEDAVRLHISLGPDL